MQVKKKASPCQAFLFLACMLMYFVFMLQCQKVQNNCKILLKSNMVVTTTQSFYTGTYGEKNKQHSSLKPLNHLKAKMIAISLRAVPELNVWEGRPAASFFLHGWLVF